MTKESEHFRKHAHQFVDWMADYMDEIENYPVKSQSKPKDIYNHIEPQIPKNGTDISTIFKDFQEVIMPGITHWQNPNFYAYFPANSSPPSLLAEMLTATLGIQGMKWETSPASTELEERMMEWLQDAIGIPKSWSGVIHDTASTATLSSIITAREQLSNNEINNKGFKGYANLRVYCSVETHSSIEKGAKIAGIGKENVVKIPTNAKLEMNTRLLEKQIFQDVKNGYRPLCIVAALGTTGTMAMDSILEIGKIANRHHIWFHVDAAYAGSALLLEEYQYLLDGIEYADSFVFNPHKWLFTNFDCTAYFMKDKDLLVNTFAILPEYLKTQSDHLVSNHCDWGIPLGRRFRSLKLWFVMRYYGLKGLKDKLRLHMELAAWMEDQINESENFHLIVPRSMNLLCFYHQANNIGDSDIETTNKQNQKLVQKLNQVGKIYLTHTKVDSRYTIRMCIGQTNVTKQHVEKAWDLIQSAAKELEN